MDLLPEPLTDKITPGKITPGKITLAVVPRRAIQPLLEMAARLALHAPLRVLDGGNCFNAYIVAQALRPALLPALLAQQARAQQARQQTQDVEAALERIRVARAFTCYQMVTLLDETEAIPAATLVLDLLATFRDETVPMAERQRLLGHCLERLELLAAAGPLLVSASPDGGPPMSSPHRQRQATPGDELLVRLERAADQVWRFSSPAPPAVQLRLW
jgi:hypothetical protein